MNTLPNRSACRWWFTPDYLLLATLLIMALVLLSQPAQAQLLTGTYTGNGNDNRAITQVGFQPDVVIVKSSDKEEAVIRTSTMSGDNAKLMIKGDPLTANYIQSLDANGFTVGDDIRVNADTIAFYWMAFKAADGELAVGSYTGDGNDDRIIDISDTSDSSDFQPDYVMVLGAASRIAYQRFSALASGDSFKFKGGAETNRIQDFVTNGFEVGTDDNVNKASEIYHYVAWKAVANKVAVGSYTGNDTDDREITGVGFEPEYVMTKTDSGGAGAHHPASLGFSTDSTLDFDSQINFADGIQDLRPGGCSNCFEVGRDKQVNENSKTVYWIAFARQSPTLVTLRSFTATRHQGGVLLQWRTGLDVNNLGWHVYREVDGERVRLTPGLIAGAALMYGPGIRLTAGNSYRWWDPAGHPRPRRTRSQH